MNARELKRFMKPLLARNPDLVMRDPFIYVRPIRHIGRALRLDGGSWKYRITPSWHVMPMFLPDFRFDLRWGGEQIADHFGFDAREPVDIAYITHVFEQGALPLLRAIDTIEAFLTFFYSQTYANVLFSNYQAWILCPDRARAAVRCSMDA